MYWSFAHFADSDMARNLGFTTLIVLYERELFVISRTTRYSSTTSIPLENMRLIHTSPTEKVVYNWLSFQATNHCPETFVTAFNKSFVHPHQRQSDPTIRKVLLAQNSRALSTPINPRNLLRSSCWSCSVVFQRKRWWSPRYSWFGVGKIPRKFIGNHLLGAIWRPLEAVRHL